MTFRFAVRQGRAIVVTGDGSTYQDLEEASKGKFGPTPAAVYGNWKKVREFANTLTGGATLNVDELDNPSPDAAQVFAVGLNYRHHAAEMKSDVPKTPLIFSKYRSCFNAPNGDVPITTATIDWECELVLVVGSGGRDISRTRAWDAIAGVCIGQDVSDRALQYANNPPQFGLGKSRKGFAPFGPWITDVKDLPNCDDLEVRCTVSGEVMQHDRTTNFVFDIPTIIEFLSTVVELYPGDVIYTGSPSGVGTSRTPQRYLKSGDVIVSELVGHATITNHCV